MGKFVPFWRFFFFFFAAPTLKESGDNYLSSSVKGKFNSGVFPTFFLPLFAFHLVESSSDLSKEWKANIDDDWTFMQILHFV